VLPRQTFVASDIPAEWVSHEPVQPLEIFPVGRGDFPFADRLFRFTHPESSWVRLGRLMLNGWLPSVRRRSAVWRLRD
jgi:hypothetical protein